MPNPPARAGQSEAAEPPMPLPAANQPQLTTQPHPYAESDAQQHHDELEADRPDGSKPATTGAGDSPETITVYTSAFSDSSTSSTSDMEVVVRLSDEDHRARQQAAVDCSSGLEVCAATDSGMLVGICDMPAQHAVTYQVSN